MTSNANTGFPDSPLEGYEPTGDRVVFAEIDSTTVTTTNGITHGKFATSGGGGGPVTVADGADVAQGTTTQTKATDGSATSWSVIQLLKGIFDWLINHSIAVTGTFWQTTQPTSAASGQFVDGSIAAIGTTTQTKATDATTTSWSVVQLLKGILNSLLTSIAVTGTFWQATQPVSGTVTANAGTGNMGSNLTQVGSATIATGNNAVPVLNAASAGAVAAYGSNAAALTANTDYQFKWGGGGTTQVNHVMLQNNSGSSVSWDDSAATTAGSATLATGQTLFLDVQTANFHLQATGTPNVNGTSANNLVIRGWL